MGFFSSDFSTFKQELYEFCLSLMKCKASELDYLIDVFTAKKTQGSKGEDADRKEIK